MGWIFVHTPVSLQRLVPQIVYSFLLAHVCMHALNLSIQSLLLHGLLSVRY